MPATLKVLVSGATGLIGSAVVEALQSEGHSVLRLSRRAEGRDVRWDPVAGELEAGRLEGFDAVVHLAGESIAGRWNARKKGAIRDSRVKGTRLLSSTIARLDRRPAVLVSASAVGFYGSRGDEVLYEQSEGGHGFLAEVCRQWEAATEPAAQAGVRVVRLRFGVVLSGRGGALGKMLGPFRLGLGGILGDGRQYWSWVALEDVVGAVRHVLQTPSLSGPLNVVAPQAVTNREFTRTLGRLLRRPTVLPMPAAAARVVFGEMADALLLASQRVEPRRLVASGYRFRFPELEGALRHALGQG